MTWEAWLTLVTVTAILVVLARDLLPPAPTLLGGVVLLLVAGVIDPATAFAGFSNPAPITVAALYVLAGAVEVTGALDRPLGRLLDRGRGGVGSTLRLLRLCLPVGVASAFLNNTPIVAMVSPRVLAWARRTGQTPSAYLIPVSFAAILGGLITVVGTSTNLVVSGLMVADGQAQMGMFEVGRVGLPLAVVGIALMALFAPRLLPDREPPDRRISMDGREFTVEMLVEPGGGLVGASVAEAGLRALDGVYLVEIARADRHIAPVRPDEVLGAGDRLTFAGDVYRIVDLQRLPGLRPLNDRMFTPSGNGAGPRFYEAIVSPHSSLVGSTLRDSGFRSRYNAAVVAIHRDGEPAAGKLGDIRLRGGDLLLVLAERDFTRRWRGHHDFLLVAGLDKKSSPPRRERAGVVAVIAAALFASVGLGLLEILQAALLAAAALLVLRVITLAEAREAINLQALVVIATSFGLGGAIQSSGLAEVVAEGTLSALSWLGPIGLLAGVLLASLLLTELITNNAAAVLMFPVAMATAAQASLNPRPFAFAVAIGASASFLTPIGYQTNTMVYGLGGYRFGDFAPVGAPLTVVLIVLTLVLLPAAWPLGTP